MAAAATWLVVAVGVALRLRQWLFGRAFWHDELLLLRSLRTQPIGGLLDPLPYDQSAPVGWVTVQHAALALSDGDERAMRLLPLLFGCAALVVVALLARTLLGGPAALVATALTAASPALIQYANEFKQYSADACWVPLVLLLGCRFALSPAERRRAWPAVLPLAATAAVAIWFSHAAALAAVGVFGALGIRAVAGRRWRELLLLLAAAAPFGIGLAAEYVLVLGRNADNRVLQDYWVGAFPAEPLTGAGLLDWLGQRAAGVARDPLGVQHPAVLIALLLAGLAVLGVRRTPALPVLLLPVAVVAAAGIGRSYPISGRLALFLVPLAAVVLAAPLDLLPLAARVLHPPARVVALTAAGCAAVATGAGLVVVGTGQVQAAVRTAGRPFEVEESRAAMEYVAARRVDGDLVLVDGRGDWLAAGWYGPRTGLGSYQLLELRRPGDGCAATWLGAGLRGAGGPTRVWLVAAHVVRDDLHWYEAHLSRFGPQVDRLHRTGAHAVLYDPASGPPAATVPPPRSRCLRVTDPAGRR